MEVKIKNQNELIDATIEMVDGIMVVSPKKVDFEPKEGNIITCTNDACTYTLILKEVRGTVVYSYAVLLDNGCFKTNDWSSYMNPRPATEEEKQKLFDKLAEEGYKWDADKKQLVKLKWKPKDGEAFHFPIFSDVLGEFDTGYQHNDNTRILSVERGWCFKTEEECQAFCDRINQAIENIKP